MLKSCGHGLVDPTALTVSFILRIQNVKNCLHQSDRQITITHKLILINFLFPFFGPFAGERMCPAAFGGFVPPASINM